MENNLSNFCVSGAIVNRGSATIHIPDLSVNSGKSILIQGRSGVGKTSLLYALSGLLQIAKGEIRYNDEIINSASNIITNDLRSKLFSFVFADFKLINDLSVLDNIKFSASANGIKFKMQTISELMEELSIAEISNLKVNTISQGQKQRVAIARAIIARPKIIFADEPTSALDGKNAIAAMNALKNYQIRNNAILIAASHDNMIDGFFDKIITMEYDNAIAI